MKQNRSLLVRNSAQHVQTIVHRGVYKDVNQMLIAGLITGNAVRATAYKQRTDVFSVGIACSFVVS